ncbi:MAG: POTRA domain-containing protein [Fibrobacterota bacterium]
MKLKDVNSAIIILFFATCVFSAGFDIHIECAENIGDTAFYNSVAEGFFLRDSSETIDSSAFEKGFELLTQSDYFENVTYERREDEEVYEISLLPTFVLSEIQIRGAAPLFESDIFSLMSLRAGSRVTSNEIRDEVLILEEELGKYFGLINPRVDVSALYDFELGTVALELTIEKDGIFRIDEVQISGNREYSDRRLMFISGLWRDGGGHFFLRDVEDNIDKITDYYYSRDYPECVVEWEYDFDRQSMEVDIEINITEGPQYDIDYSQVSPLNRFEVRRMFDFSNKGNHNDFTLNKVVFDLRRELRSRGYNRGRVSFEDTVYTRDERTYRDIEILVDTVESRIRVQDIFIQGNSFFSESRIKDILNTKEHSSLPWINGRGNYNNLRIVNDIQRIRNQYLHEGFLHAEIDHETDSLGEKNIALTMTVDEGERTEVNSITYTGTEIDTAIERLDSEKLPFFRIEAVRSHAEYIEEYYTDRGYHFADVSYSLEYNSDSSEVDIAYTIEPGHQVRLAHIYISGNLNTDANFLQRISRLEPGAPFVQRDINAGIRRMRNVTSIQSLNYSIVGLEEGYEDVDLFVYTTENRPYAIQAGIAYDTRNSFNLSVSARNKNVFHRDRHLSLSGFVSANRQGEADLTFANPHFLYRDIRAASSVYFNYGIRGVDSNYSEAGNTNSLSWNITEQLRGNISLSFEARDIANREAIRNAVQLSTGLTYDTRDSFIRPRNGAFITTDVDLSYGFSYEVDNFVRTTGEIRRYITPFEFITLAGRLSLGGIKNYSSLDSVGSDRLLTLGGMGSVRAFEEGMLYFETQEEDGDISYSPRGGFGSAFANMEVRVPLFWSLEAAGFYDIGILTESADFSRFEEPRAGYGAGIRYLTPVGAVGVLHSRKTSQGLNSIREKGYLDKNPYLWLFSINYTF